MVLHFTCAPLTVRLWYDTEAVHTLEPEVVEEESSKEAETTSCKVLPGEGSEVRVGEGGS